MPRSVKSTQLEEQDFDFEVPFNAKQTYGEWTINGNPLTIGTQDELDSAVCPIVKKSVPPSQPLALPRPAPVATHLPVPRDQVQHGGNRGRGVRCRL